MNVSADHHQATASVKGGPTLLVVVENNDQNSRSYHTLHMLSVDALAFCYLKVRPQTSSTDIIWEFIKKAASQARLRPTESEPAFNKIPQVICIHSNISEAVFSRFTLAAHMRVVPTIINR